MEHLILACAGGFYASPMADDVADFFQNHPLPGVQRKIAQVCVREPLKGGIRLIDRFIIVAIFLSPAYSNLARMHVCTLQNYIYIKQYALAWIKRLKTKHDSFSRHDAGH